MQTCKKAGLAILFGATISALAIPTYAATIQLDNLTPSGANFLFTYGGSLASSEGLKQNVSKLVIFDFAGYVAGSVSSSIADVSASAELLSSVPLPPGVVDDPTLMNLVFTWIGPDLQTTPGTYSAIDFTGLSALSTFGGVSDDGAFSGLTVKNRGLGTVGQTVFSQGSVGTPVMLAVPEPGSWAMLVGGFGLLGAMLRSRKSTPNFA